MIYDIAINILVLTSANYDTTTAVRADWINQIVTNADQSHKAHSLPFLVYF